MKLLCDKRGIEEVLKHMELEFEVVGSEVLDGYKMVHHQSGLFYIEEAEGETLEACVVEMSSKDIWNLDKFQSTICLEKEAYSIINGRLTKDGDVYAYRRRQDESSLENLCSLEVVKYNNLEERQLSTCDLYLMIPGKLEKSQGNANWEQLPNCQRDIFRKYSAGIQTSIEGEYNSNFAQELQRKCLGDVKIELLDREGNVIETQDGIIGIVEHMTGLCIVEIMVHNCHVGGTRILVNFCGNALKFHYNGKSYAMNELLEHLHLRPFGKKRSMVFNYGEPDKREIINALANEEFPMGRIHGSFLKKVETENRAQYDTAEVYCSSETMFEQCKDMNILVDDRIGYHVIEIFFVELVIFQDAAIEKICSDIRGEITKQLHTHNLLETQKRQEAISFDMAQVMRFTNYEDFKYPTVRESAKRIAHDFEIDCIFENYEKYKEQLNDMISINERRMSEEQNNIKNYFLFLLSALAVIGTMGEIIYTVNCDLALGTISYGASIIIVDIIYGIYKIVDRTFMKNSSRNRKRS